MNQEYPFARFNKKPKVISYTNEEYEKCVLPLMSDWDRTETDCLFDLVSRFGPRFIVIADRFADELTNK